MSGNSARNNKRDLLRSMSQQNAPTNPGDLKETKNEDPETILKVGNNEVITHEKVTVTEEKGTDLRDSPLFTIQPKQKKLPKAVTHTVITPEIETTLLNEFDNIRSHLQYSRAELLESVMRDYITLVKQTNPEWAEKPAPKSGRRRR
ncbi:hypothetical protein EJP82_26025 [Paenibacillus anaericanus]|uniref:Uncharacterized protein n=1 Tax=Paenibacillus anaericanus TaxID=170367 RepID=A0A3S1DJE4_9BACL|nr:hypothetical protein [Paenibacillus anaericanus]RUT39491.1 hypothetical protein EJP82_26025 [Paenibacillus anaericanus]